MPPLRDTLVGYADGDARRFLGGQAERLVEAVRGEVVVRVPPKKLGARIAVAMVAIAGCGGLKKTFGIAVMM